MDDLTLCAAVANGLSSMVADITEATTVRDLAEWALTDGEGLDFVEKRLKIPFPNITAYEYILLRSLFLSCIEIADNGAGLVDGTVGITLAITKGVACTSICVPINSLEDNAPYCAERKLVLKISCGVFRNLTVRDNGADLHVFNEVKAFPDEMPLVAFLFTFNPVFMLRFMEACKKIQD